MDYIQMCNKGDERDELYDKIHEVKEDFASMRHKRSLINNDSLKSRSIVATIYRDARSGEVNIPKATIHRDCNFTEFHKFITSQTTA